jgi:hypothetical protein
MRPLLAVLAVFGFGLLAPPASLQDTPRNPYTQPATAYYDVAAWPASFASPGYIRASNSGIFVESPDRIYLISRGEIKLPEQLPANFNGTISSLPEQVARQNSEKLVWPATTSDTSAGRPTSPGCRMARKYSTRLKPPGAGPRNLLPSREATRRCWWADNSHWRP